MTAASDDDAANGTAAFVHQSSIGSFKLVTATLTATEADDDERGYMFSVSSLSVSEGGSVVYGVKLTSAPVGGTAYIDVLRVTGGDRDIKVGSSNRVSLEFDATDWNEFQSVTVTADEDSDAVSSVTAIAHAGDQTDYQNLRSDLAVTEIDNDVALLFSTTALTVSEGGTAAYGVKLGAKPASSVTVAVSKASGSQDTDLTVPTGTSLTFTTGNWSSFQSVAVTAASDDDAANGTAAFVHESSIGSFNLVTATLTATEADNDERGYMFSVSSLSVSEGGSVVYGVKLTSAPVGGTAYVDVIRVTGGDRDIKVGSSNRVSLEFDATDWNEFQSVTVTADEDSDAVASVTAIAHAGDQTDYQNLRSDLAVTEIDNDASLLFSTTMLTVSEGGTASYGVKLAASPGTSVSVTIAPHATGNQDTDLVVKSGSPLVFSATDWNDYQSVVLSAKSDDDGANGTTQFIHTAQGGAYGSITGTITATERDDDPAISLSRSTLLVPEGSVASYGVQLAAKPGGNVTVSVARKGSGSQDGNLSVKAGSELVFTTGNWDSDQMVTLSASDDHDALAGQAEFLHQIVGGVYAASAVTLVATENENDVASILFSTTALTVTEGESSTYAVRLSSLPARTVTVAIANSSTGVTDPDFSINVAGTTNASLTFTTADWSVAQTATVSAVEDDDAVNGQTSILHTATGGDYGRNSVSASLPATEDDNDSPAILLSTTSLAVPETSTVEYQMKLATRPSGTVTISVSRDTSDDQDTNLMISGSSSLVFTTANWNQTRPVTLSASADSDILNGTANFIHRSTGGDYGERAITATLFATEADNDAVIVLSTDSLTVTEALTATYGVKLKTVPLANVTVSVAPGTDNEDENLTVQGNTNLIFSPTNWHSFQTVILSASADEDAANGEAQIVNRANGGGYDSVTATLRAVEKDTDTAAIMLSAQSLTVTEGNEATYTITLATKPTQTVQVTVMQSSSSTREPSLSIDLGGTSDLLTFTDRNWTVAQTVTVSAAEDDDAANGTAIIDHRSSGGEYTAVTQTLSAVESDNDTPGFEFSVAEISVPENGSATFRVSLATRPTAAVTVTARRSTEGVQDGDISVAGLNDQAMLTFTTANWSIAQNVTVTAASDDDAYNGTANILHTASGGDYGSVRDTLNAVEADTDEPGLTLSVTSLSVPEGSTATYRIKLAKRPSTTVTVTAAKLTGTTIPDDPDLKVKGTDDRQKLIFSTQNWDSELDVTVTAAEDDDAIAGKMVIVHQTSGGEYDSAVFSSLTVTESENDTAGLRLSANSVSLPEGGTANYTVELATRPSAQVTVTVQRSAGGTADTDISVTSPSDPNELTFTTATWSTAQTVELAASEDEDAVNGSAQITHTASGADYGQVTGMLDAVEVENDTPGLMLSNSPVSIPEGGTAVYTVKLATQPSTDVIVTAERRASGSQDSDIRVSGTGNQAILSFSAANWNDAATVTLTAAQDDDALVGSAVIDHAASGGEYDLVTAALDAVEIDDDSPGLTLSTDSIEIDENGSATYTVRLDTRPSSPVQVLVRRSQVGTQDHDISVQGTNGQRTLNFTLMNWNTPQTVVLTASEDNDTLAGSAAISHTASGGDYGSVSRTLAAVERDNDMAGLILSASDATVPEGAIQTYLVRLATQPAELVRVTVSRQDTGSQDTDLKVRGENDQQILSFAPDRWSQDATVTLTADQDDDAVHGSAQILHAASGADYGSVAATLTATEADDDVPDLILSTESISVPESGRATYEVKLSLSPTTGTRPTISVTVGRVADGRQDESIRVLHGTGQSLVLSFTSANWSIGQTVTLTAESDDDSESGRAQISHAAVISDSFVARRILVAVETEATPLVNQAVKAYVSQTAQEAASHIETVLDRRFSAPYGTGFRGQLADESLATRSSERYPSDIRSLLDGLPVSGRGQLVRNPAGPTGLSADDLMSKSRFSVSAETDDGRIGSFWLQGTVSGFDGGGPSPVEGRARSVTFGADYRSSRRLLGLAVSHIRSNGHFRNAANSAEFAIRATGLYPYVHWRSGADWSYWAAAGYAAGRLHVTPAGAGMISTDLKMIQMMAGFRHLLVAGRDRDDFELALDGRVRWLNSRTDAMDQLQAINEISAEFAIGLEASWQSVGENGSLWTQQTGLDVINEEQNDARSFGLQARAAAGYQSPNRTVSINLSGRALVLHEISDRREWSLSAEIAFDPEPDSPLGLSAKLSPNWKLSEDGNPDGPGIASASNERSSHDSAAITGEVRFGFPEMGGRAIGAIQALGSVDGNNRRLGFGYSFDLSASDGYSVRMGLRVDAEQHEGQFAPAGASINLSLGW